MKNASNDLDCPKIRGIKDDLGTDNISKRYSENRSNVRKQFIDRIIRKSMQLDAESGFAGPTCHDISS